MNKKEYPAFYYCESCNKEQPVTCWLSSAICDVCGHENEME